VATFTVWKFDDPDGAHAAADVLEQAERDKLITVVDHAVVTWPVGAKKPKVRRHDDTRRGASWGAFWGLLFGAVFFVPLVGALAGAAVGTVGGGLFGESIDKEQIETLRWQIKEGTSALFVLTDDADLEQVAARFAGMPLLLIDTSLTDVERARLLGAFGPE
jgi:uncharacterized membrane protein